MALLIEHYNGKWPFWLNPRQIIILTVNDQPDVIDFARSTKNFLGIGDSRYPMSADLDESGRSLKKKISEAKRKHYGVIVVIGKDNVGTQTVNVDFSGLPNVRWLAGHLLAKARENMKKAMSFQKEARIPKEIGQWMDLAAKFRFKESSDITVEDLRDIKIHRQDLKGVLNQFQSFERRSDAFIEKRSL